MESKAVPDDFWSTYRNLASKLKKRFLKKPNVADVAEEFGSLAKRLTSDEQRQLSGVCSLAVARCEQTLGNLPAESEALLSAARSFLRQEEENYDLRLPTFDEHLINALSYFNMATNVYLDCKQPHLASGVCLEAGNALRRLGKTEEAVGCFLRAAEIESKFPLSHLDACRSVVSCYIELGDYEMALSTLTEMAKSTEDCQGTQSAYTDLKAEVEVTSLLLLLFLQYPAMHLKPEHAKILKRFSPEADGDSTADSTSSSLKDDCVWLLQSLVLAMQMKDYDTLKTTETQLVGHLNKDQRDILRHIVIASRNVFNM